MPVDLYEKNIPRCACLIYFTITLTKETHMINFVHFYGIRENISKGQCSLNSSINLLVSDDDTISWTVLYRYTHTHTQ